MEYYAKSKKRNLSEAEKQKLKDILEDFLEKFEKNFSDLEKQTLYKAEKKLLEDCEELQKTLKEHLDETVQCAENFFEQYGGYFTEKEKILIITACQYHDLGKLNFLFQKKINPSLAQQKNKDQEIPHGYLSAVSIPKKKFLEENPEISESEFYAMITAIYYHHTRSNDFDARQLREYSEKYYIDAIKEYLEISEWEINAASISHLLFKNEDTAQNLICTEKEWNNYLLIKGMLNKFDWTASAGISESETAPDLQKKYLKTSIEQKWNGGFRPAQSYMREHTEENLIITASTGSGKTEAALLWLNGEKGFYTLPLKVSSNAIYDRIKMAYAYEPAALLHSDSMTKYLEDAAGEDADGYEKYERAKLLSAPLTICTVDQLFKFVYKALGTEIFPAVLKYSKLILDEIQAYSPRVVASILYGLKTIVAMGGKFAIITATFPPILKVFMEKYGLIENREYLFKDFSKEDTSRRHQIILQEGELPVEEITDRGRGKKVLVICNTVSKAQELYQKIEEQTEQVWLLHSRFIRKDRDILEKAIMNFSKEESSVGIWVTTQIVEASLDIDFDILYTEMCPADSLLQRMGRCNRRGKTIPSEPNIFVYDSGNGKKSIYDAALYERSVRYLRAYEQMIFSEELKNAYIECVYDPKEIQGTSYYMQIEEYLQYFSKLFPAEYTKTEADKEFRNIQSITAVPDCVYEENREFFENYRALIKTAHIGREVKAIVSAKLDELTLSINLFYGKYPLGVDKNPICDTQIHRANLKYEFYPEMKKGRGLLLNEKKDEECFFC